MDELQSEVDLLRHREAVPEDRITVSSISYLQADKCEMTNDMIKNDHI